MGIKSQHKKPDMNTFPSILLLILTTKFGTLRAHRQLRVVDLTHAQDENTIYWPGNPDYNFTVISRGQQANFWYESNYFGTAEHGGTHIDAPAHFYKGAYRNQQIPMERLIGPGVVINVKDKVANNLDYRVAIEDLQNWENSYGRIPYGAIVMMNSGWAVKYGNRSEYFGTSEPNDPSTFHFPGFHEDAAEWLVTNRMVHVVGVDTASLDYGQSTTFPVHVIFGRENICGAENVANLDRLPENGTMIFIGAIKLFDGSGGPARVFATYYEDENDDTINGGRNIFNRISFMITVSVHFILIYFHLI